MNRKMLSDNFRIICIAQLPSSRDFENNLDTISQLSGKILIFHRMATIKTNSDILIMSELYIKLLVYENKCTGDMEIDI